MYPFNFYTILTFISLINTFLYESKWIKKYLKYKKLKIKKYIFVKNIIIYIQDNKHLKLI